MRILPSICALLLLISCSGNEGSEFDFMVGTWKMEGKEQYEVWDKNEDIDLVGYSYKLNNNEKTITETLTIKRVEGQIIYEATVPDQNEGRTVPFTLNTNIKSYLSFENDNHDFPKKIQYKKIGDGEIEVTVSGDEGEGFSFIQIKQKTE